MKARFRVAGREVGPGLPPYKIADAAAHHEGDVQLGYKLIETAGASGTDAIVFDAPRPGGSLSERDFKSLLGHAYYVGLTAFGTASDAGQVSFLASLDTPAFVLADAGSASLLEAGTATGKPLFVLDSGNTLTGEATHLAILRPRDAESLIEIDGHVIMTRHTLERARRSAAAGAMPKERQRA
jgi:sialic acid synthase SpsE